MVLALLSFFVLSAPCLAIMVLAIGLASLTAAAVSDIAMKSTKLNNRISNRRGSCFSGLQLGGFTVLCPFFLAQAFSGDVMCHVVCCIVIYHEN